MILSFPTVALLVQIFFTTDFGCIQHIDDMSSSSPLASRVYRHKPTQSFIELHGGHVMLRCEGREYTATILEDK